MDAGREGGALPAWETRNVVVDEGRIRAPNGWIAGRGDADWK